MVGNGQISELGSRTVAQAVDREYEGLELQQDVSVGIAERDQVQGVQGFEGSKHLDQSVLARVSFMQEDDGKLHLRKSATSCCRQAPGGSSP